MIPAEQSHLQIAADSHPGMMGKNNEDQFSVSAFQLSATDTTPSLFAILADGIGGHQAGEVASEIAVEMISQAAAQSDGSQPTAIMQAAIIQASQAILAESKREGADGKLRATLIGMPLLDSRGRLIGVNTAIMLEALDVVYDADHLIEELTIVE